MECAYYFDYCRLCRSLNGHSLSSPSGAEKEKGTIAPFPTLLDQGQHYFFLFMHVEENETQDVAKNEPPPKAPRFRRRLLLDTADESSRHAPSCRPQSSFLPRF
jgi:hypothetical protein